MLLIMAIIAPPVAVFMMRGCGHEVVICLLLGLCLFVFLSPYLCALCLADPSCCDQHYPWTHLRLLPCRQAPQMEEDWPVGCLRICCTVYQVQCCPRSESL